MPRIDLIPEVYYEALQPYHYLFDNMPLRNILARITMLNDTLEIDHGILSDSVGTAGSLALRLDASLEGNGYLKTSAVDAALHGIEAHTDTIDQSDFLLEDDEFVRMTERERDKLSLVQSSANWLTLNFETAGPSETPVNFDNGEVALADSVSTSWRYEDGKIYLDMNFPLEAAHRHYYSVVPTTVDYQTFVIPLAYAEDSLRVYVNGVRLDSVDAIYHPGPTPSDDWVLNKYTAATDSFVLDQAVTEYDMVRIDFEVAFL